MPVSSSYKPAPIYLELGEGFADTVAPAKFPKLQLRFRNQRWAERVGLGDLTPDEWQAKFAAFEPLDHNLPRPLALRYHGHQFRSYNPDIGDGRGFLYAQLKDNQARVLDLGTKGSGTTPYSRRGDGRLTLKGAVREVLATEMLEARGVNTSKTFSVFETGEALERHDEPSPTRAAVLVRLNHSYLRFGTFQRLATLREPEKMRELFAYAHRHYFAELAPSVPVVLREIARRSAELCASWMIAGFVHGVLNTDNMNITGESFDYGPYRFAPSFDPQFTAAYFDQTGLYAFGRQPESVLWNLEQLALALSAIEDEAALIEALQIYPDTFNRALRVRFLERLGVQARGDDEDERLTMAAFRLLHDSQMDYDQFFHDWRGGEVSRPRAENSVDASVYTGEQFEVFFSALSGYKPTTSTWPAYFQRARPCSLLIDEIEAIWAPIAMSDDWSKFEAKIEEIRAMGAAYGNDRTHERNG